MDNQRPTDKPYQPRKFQDNRNQDNRSQDNRNQDNRNQDNRPRDNSGFRSNNNPNNQNQPRENNDRFQPRPGGFKPREGSEPNQNRDNRSNFPPRQGQDNRNFRDNRSGDPRDNRGGQSNYRPNTGGGGGGFQPRPAGKFQPRGKFQPGGKPSPKWKIEDDIKIVSEKQITDGKHKGKYLKNSVSPKSRITVRRIREAMFKILSRKVRAGRVLDLCAGSGTIGIEAISRGAITATFVEKSSKMCSFIKANLKDLEIKEGHGNVVEIEAAPFLTQVSRRKRNWDIVYLDVTPDEGYDEILGILSRGVSLAPKGVLVIEHPSEVFLPEKSGVLRRWRVVAQGDRAISFFERV